jgi:methylmalonyl-CoA/ethylmalonyl-CoA epimerase
MAMAGRNFFNLFEKRSFFPMKIKQIDHIGVAVKGLKDAGMFYKEKLGLEMEGMEEIPDQKVRVAFFPIGESEVELLESTAPDGPVSKYINARGEGIQHIAFRVDDIDGALKELKEKGVRLIDKEARKGAGGAKIAFIHPGETNGVLVELCERE